MESIQSTVGSSFSRESVNYSMVWEDPKLLLNTAKNLQNPKILSISSAGDNALSLLSLSGSSVTAVDMSEPQNQLLKLKKVALSRFSHEDYLKLLGYLESSPSKRLELYQKIKNELDNTCLIYWTAQEHVIKEGLIHCGRLEKYFNKFQEHGVQRIFSSDELDFLVNNKNIELQKQKIHEKTPHIKSFLADYFNQKSFSSEGRSEAQYKYVKKEVSIEKHITERTLEALQTQLIAENSYLHYIFTKTFSLDNLPDHVQAESFQKIKNNIENLEIITSDIESLLSGTQNNYDFFNLSDVFEYVSEEHFEVMLNVLNANSSQRAKICYWSLFVDRTPSKASHWELNTALSKKMFQIDRVWFYKNFHILEKT